jgi:hypothetical protein
MAYTHMGVKESNSFLVTFMVMGATASPQLACTLTATVGTAFACGKARDAIGTLREKWGYDFNQACAYLEKTYGISYTPSYENQEGSDTGSNEPTLSETWEKEAKRVNDLLSGLSSDFKDVSWLIPLWEGFDYLSWRKTKENKFSLGDLKALREKAINITQEKIKRGDL